MKKIFLDTETTGIGDTHRIIQIAACAYDNHRQKIDEFNKHVNPQRAIDKEAERIHGINSAFLADKPLFTDIVDSFIEFIADSDLYIHNAEFDCRFIDNELSRLKRPPLNKISREIICTLEWSRKNNKHLHSHSLDNLCRRFDINATQRDKHDALLDTELLAKLWFAMNQQQQGLTIPNSNPLHNKEVAKRVQINKDNTGIIVRATTPEELATHQAYLQKMQKDSKTKTTPIFTQLSERSD